MGKNNLSIFKSQNFTIKEARGTKGKFLHFGGLNEELSAYLDAANKRWL
jgi:hypothetical protein